MTIFDELPQRFSNKKSKNRYTYIEALDNQLKVVQDFIADAKNQYYFCSASGKYLLRLATQYGFDFKNSTIYTPGLLRKVAPLISYQPQAVKPTLWRIIDAFYPTEYTRANLKGSEGPFDLTDSVFVVSVGGETEEIRFDENGFDDISQATIDEVVQYTNSRLKNAKFFKKRASQDTSFIGIRSRKLGHTEIQIVGGDANLAFLFDSPIIPVSQQVNISKGLSPVVTITFTGDSLAYEIRTGDFLTIKSDPLTGVFPVETVSANTITLRANMEQGSFDVTPDVLFYQKQDSHTLEENNLYALMDEASNSTEVFFTLPAGAPIEIENDEEATYVWGSKIDITSFTRDTIELSESIQNESLSFIVSGPTKICSREFSGSNQTPGIIESQAFPWTVFTPGSAKQEIKEIVITLNHEHKLSPGVEVEFQGGITGVKTVSRILSSNVFTIDSPTEYEQILVARILPGRLECFSVVDAQTFLPGNQVILPGNELRVTRVQGSSVFFESRRPISDSGSVEVTKTKNIDPAIEYKVDPSQDFYNDWCITIREAGLSSYLYGEDLRVREISGTLSKPIYANSNVQLQVTTDEEFPSSGTLVIDFGNEKEEHVKYTRVHKISSVEIGIQLDPSSSLQFDHLAGAALYLTEEVDEEFRVPYLQSTADKRKECVRVLEEAVAGGVETTPEILYPEYINEDPSNIIFE